MKAPLVLCLDDDLIVLARREAERQNRSLDSFFEGMVIQALQDGGKPLPPVIWSAVWPGPSVRPPAGCPAMDASGIDP
jgi:hypothetical protein